MERREQRLCVRGGFENARGEIVTNLGILRRKHANAKGKGGMVYDYVLGRGQAMEVMYKYATREANRG